MAPVLRYRGRDVHSDDIAFLRQFIANSPQASRRALSLQLCGLWGWAQPNGMPCDALCRGLMLQLHRAGHLVLPPARWGARQPRRHSVVQRVVVVPTPLTATLAELGPLEIRQVRRTPEEALVKSLVDEHHYLGYVHPVGEHLKYLVTARGQPIACFCWSSAPRHLGPRDQHIGWSADTRRANIRFVAYQSRFLILPWVTVPHLASHLLGAISRRLSADWEEVYAHPIYFTETFVDPALYRGTCYRAANWVLLGITKGRGKDAPTKEQNRSLKQVFGCPLVKDFRRRLGVVNKPCA
ncbi:MAG: DUF4338 domain-containing protein [Candidatus Eisenbacteria bacterium]|nr:DUF4338 domain-containing protein [Candidatus Eisenbacteria bacterium]